MAMLAEEDQDNGGPDVVPSCATLVSLLEDSPSPASLASMVEAHPNADSFDDASDDDTHGGGVVKCTFVHQAASSSHLATLERISDAISTVNACSQHARILHLRRHVSNYLEIDSGSGR